MTVMAVQAAGETDPCRRHVPTDTGPTCIDRLAPDVALGKGRKNRQRWSKLPSAKYLGVRALRIVRVSQDRVGRLLQMLVLFQHVLQRHYILTRRTSHDNLGPSVRGRQICKQDSCTSISAYPIFKNFDLSLRLGLVPKTAV